jgi:LPXTG-motif cell wall-anchored protein
VRRGTVVATLAAVAIAVTGPSVLAALSDSSASANARLGTAAIPTEGERAALGDRVWRDDDHDGRQDPGEPGLDGVTVTLRTGATVVAHLLTSTVAGQAGTYRFADLEPGEYTVTFGSLPAGHRFTTVGAIAGDGGDSDADPGTGTTPVVRLDAGEEDLTVDAGAWAPAPALHLAKSAQGVAADEAPGPSVPEGTSVAFAYVVTNTGNEVLDGLAVVDDRGVVVTCPTTTLLPGATVACAGTGAAVPGPYTNLGTAVATGRDSGVEVRGTDSAHYLGVATGLDVELTVDGDDADQAAQAPEVRTGTDVTWAYRVENTGAEAVIGVAVVDDAAGTVACPTDVLPPGEGMDCTPASSAAAPGLATRVATVAGTGETSGATLGDTDPASVWGRTPALTLLKEVQDPRTGSWLDADVGTSSPGANDGVLPPVLVGGTAHYRLLVANAGDVPLTDVVLEDDRCDAPPTVVAGDGAPTGTLDPGETWVATCAVDGVTAPFTNVATVRAASAFGVPEGDGAVEQASVEVVGEAAVALVKEVRSDGSPFGPSATVGPGRTAEFRLRVTNVGDAPLVDLVVEDPTVPGCDRTFAGPLPPGASTPAWTCAEPDVRAAFTNVAIVSARSVVGGTPLRADTSAAVSMTQPANLSLTKELLSRTGDRATFRLLVENHGPGSAVGPLTVADDLPAALTHVSAGGPGWSCAHAAGTVTCTRAAGLAPGTSSAVVVVVDVGPEAGPETRNLAHLVGVDDARPADDQDSAVLGEVVEPAEPPTGGDDDGPTGGSGADPNLPATGTEVLGLLLVGSGLVGAGLVLISARRRRATSPP